MTVSFTLMGCLTGQGVLGQAIQLCQSSLRGKFLPTSRIPGLPGLPQDFIRSLDLQEAPLSFLHLVPIVVRVPGLH